MCFVIFMLFMFFSFLEMPQNHLKNCYRNNNNKNVQHFILISVSFICGASFHIFCSKTMPIKWKRRWFQGTVTRCQVHQVQPEMLAQPSISHQYSFGQGQPSSLTAFPSKCCYLLLKPENTGTICNSIFYETTFLAKNRPTQLNFSENNIFT